MAEIQAEQPMTPTCMESVNRISKLPVVESTFQTATNIYEKVKDYNSVTQWTCSTAESAVHKAVEVGKPIAAPIVHGLEGPIKKVDGVLCTGLDYVESKVPAVKLPPGEIVSQMYNTTKDFVNNTVTPVVTNVYGRIEPAVQSAKTAMEPAVERAKNIVEPAVEKAKNIVEPLVQPALEKAQAIKDYGIQKYEEVMHPEHLQTCHEHEHAEGVFECDECRDAAKKNAEKSSSSHYVEHN